MYKDNETEISYYYLKEVIQHLKEPISVVGGWAVYFVVNKNFKEEHQLPYLGSRDIDLGFSKPETAKGAIKKLMELGFKRISFRYFKEIHTETGKELSKNEAKNTPLHNIFPMYVDPILAETDSSMKSKLGFMPIDEPLLKPVFEDEKFRLEVTAFGRKVIIPHPKVLLAMKLNSLPNRDKEHKKIKDLCDIVSIIMYSEAELSLDKKQVEKAVKCITKEDIVKVTQFLPLSEEVIESAIESLKR